MKKVQVYILIPIHIAKIKIVNQTFPLIILKKINYWEPNIMAFKIILHKIKVTHKVS